MTRLIPDPPLGDFPELPEDMRWYIQEPSDYEPLDYRPLRPVYVQRRGEE